MPFSITSRGNSIPYRYHSRFRVAIISYGSDTVTPGYVYAMNPITIYYPLLVRRDRYWDQLQSRCLISGTSTTDPSRSYRSSAVHQRRLGRAWVLENRLSDQSGCMYFIIPVKRVFLGHDEQDSRCPREISFTRIARPEDVNDIHNSTDCCVSRGIPYGATI